METWKPANSGELATMLREAASRNVPIAVEGQGSKKRAGGWGAAPGITISTAGLNGIQEYEPRDLTCSVGAGMPYAQFSAMLAKDGYMVPLDPPFAASATIGGVVAANSSGPRRRWFGTARDLVIGMQFATLEGKLVQSGGMVVKNVAGLDMAKLLIGSYGTLGVMATLNFKLIPRPSGSRTFLQTFPSAAAALAMRDELLRGVMQPVAFDVLNPAAAGRLGQPGWLAVVEAQGNKGMLGRFSKAMPSAQTLEGEAAESFWNGVREFTPGWLAEKSEGCVVRVSTKLTELAAAMEKAPGAVLARAANGVMYVHADSLVQAGPALGLGRAVVEYVPSTPVAGADLWPKLDSGFPIMQRIKEMFDPQHLLNRGRLHGRI
ncbi:MAG: FAD-binding oxidoreductase [Bryobacterales bacterium]|nr:FAD-binding oxidoreductase [Bryobacterales bacterium]